MLHQHLNTQPTTQTLYARDGKRVSTGGMVSVSLLRYTSLHGTDLNNGCLWLQEGALELHAL